MGRNFPVSSIFIGSQSTNGVSRCLGAEFVFPASRYPRITCFQETRFSLVPGRPMGFRGERTSDSSSPHRVTSKSIESYHSLSPCRQCSSDPMTDKQTNLFYFVRPSFQSRELRYPLSNQNSPSHTQHISRSSTWIRNENFISN
jgi:hypothetical protein